MRKLVLLLCAAWLCNTAFSQDPAIIPRPALISYAPDSFIFSSRVRIVCNAETAPIAAYLQDYCKTWHGLDILPAGEKTTGHSLIIFRSEGNRGMLKDGYKMQMTRDSIVIRGDYGGIFYGVQTLLQLLQPDPGITEHKLRCMHITDVPRFRWRGLHLDVCRHFFPKEYIKKYIDRMAFYKLNMFHWHLTEDQGWRIEIKKYPKLTEVGSQRKETIVGKNFDPYIGDGKPYGGFYTQEDIKEIVRYAAIRNVTIVPEIEMPGHSLAALTAYPELSCTGGPFEVGTKWGVYEDVFCPKEETFRFLEDVLTEVISLFPSKYIHIGGDEVPKVRWKNCVHCQELMKKEGLKTEEELQSYFIRRIEKFLRSKGKILVGWDEILEGGIAPNAVVMSWRGESGGIEAATAHHEVIMSPGMPCYFDHCQSLNANEPLCIGGYNYLKRVYDYDPVPVGIDPRDAAYIIGAQANVWTEYIATTGQLEYMVFPRLLALSEALWSSSNDKNWLSFTERLMQHTRLLQLKQINYRVPDPAPTAHVISFDAHPLVTLGPVPANGAVYYTVDGTEPSANSSWYKFPFTLNLEPKKPVTVKAIIHGLSGTRNGWSETVYQYYPLRSGGLPGKDTGLVVRKLTGSGKLYDGLTFRKKTADKNTYVADDRYYHPVMDGDSAGLWWFSGMLHVDEEGLYSFIIRTPGDAVLYLGDREVVRVLGGTAEQKTSCMVWLTPGFYPLDMQYCRRQKGTTLDLQWEYGKYNYHSIFRGYYLTH